MKRRAFLKQSAAIAASTCIGPIILGAEKKAGSNTPVIGTGAHKYECHHDWGTLPSSIQWETSHGVAVDSEGLIYITHRGYGKNVMDTVVVFDPAGKFVRSFGKQWFYGGHGIDIRNEGGEEFLYLSQNVHAKSPGIVVKTSRKGDIVWEHKGPPPETDLYKDKKPYSPTNVAFGPDGRFWVGDGYGSHYVHEYDKSAKYVRSWGGLGDGPGQMKTPHGIWLDDRKGREPSLVVADRANARLQYFTLDGKHVGFVKEVSFPAHFDIRGDVLLVPDLHARVSLFDKDNKVIAHLGHDAAWTKKVLDGFKVRNQPKDWLPGKFIHPHDACYDKDGNIFVVEWVNTGRVTLLRHVS